MIPRVASLSNSNISDCLYFSRTEFRYKICLSVSSPCISLPALEWPHPNLHKQTCPKSLIDQQMEYPMHAYCVYDIYCIYYVFLFQGKLWPQSKTKCSVFIDYLLYARLFISILEYGTGWVCPSVCLSVRVLQKPLSRCPISKLRTYSESSQQCGSIKTIWGAVGTPNFIHFYRHPGRRIPQPPAPQILFFLFFFYQQVLVRLKDLFLF